MKNYRLKVLILTVLLLSILILSACDSSENEVLDNTQYLAFVSNQTGNSEIYIIDDSGTILKQLTNNYAEDFQPAWSPDGSKIAFVSDRSGNGKGIYVISSNGSVVTDEIIPPINDITNISWSPDGKKITYSGKIAATDDYKIYYYNLETRTGSPLTSNESNDKDPDWLKDGSKIVFSSDRDGSTDLFIMDADGRNTEQFTNYVNSDYYHHYTVEPVWSPDGEKIAYSLLDWEIDSNSIYSNIITINPDTYEVNTLTFTTETQNVSPSWSARWNRNSFYSIIRTVR